VGAGRLPRPDPTAHRADAAPGAGALTAANHQSVEPQTPRLDSPLLEPEQAAEWLAVRTSWIYEAVRTNRLPCLPSAATSASRARCSSSGYANGRRRRAGRRCHLARVSASSMPILLTGTSRLGARGPRTAADAGRPAPQGISRTMIRLVAPGVPARRPAVSTTRAPLDSPA
jgi:hypothetical protein